MPDKPEDNLESNSELNLSDDALQAFLEKHASEHDDDKPAINKEPKNSDAEDEEDEENEEEGEKLIPIKEPPSRRSVSKA